jgi:hypothetical protein
LGGLYEQQQIAVEGMFAVFIAAAALVFVLLLFLYEQFHVALASLNCSKEAQRNLFFSSSSLTPACRLINQAFCAAEKPAAEFPLSIV